MKDPYAFPGGLLRNRLGIENLIELSEAEASITSMRLTILHEVSLPGDYDLNHLRAFHRFIFGDIYDWAGELRTVDIAKQDTAFCRRVHITAYAAEVFGRLKRAGFLRKLERSDFISGLADTYADINALHPFREGNGRAQRAFLRQLANDAGHPLSWAGLDGAENELASIAGFRGDVAPLVRMLDKLVAREPHEF